MDAALAQPPTTYLSNFIPNEIYRPLLEIAQQGYNANDILHWYLAIQTRVDNANIPVPYSLTPPFSVCSPAPLEAHTQLANTDATSPLDTNASTQSLYDATEPTLNPWTHPTSFETSRPPPLNVSTATSTPPQQTTDPMSCAHSGVLQMLSPWSPTTTVNFPDPTMQKLPIVEDQLENITNNMTPSTRWFTPGLDIFQQMSRGPSISQPSLYPGSMTNAAMPYMLPSQPSPGEITYFAPISIIPSRKRRKASRKGERKVLQPLPLPRQSI